MTKSTITRDGLNEVIATYGKHHIAHRMANVLLAAMDSEPVGEVIERPCSGEMNTGMTYRRVKGLGEMDSMPVGTKFYVAQPAPVVPTFDEWLELSGNKPLGWVKDAMRESYDACRAAMLAAAPQSPGSEPATVPGKWIPVSERMPDCWCRTCRPVTLNDMRFVVCPDCGNKRCPRANDHRNACTGSNEPGQEGSAYPGTPRG